jgi:putative ABC transport system ATP-binding protein
VLPPRNKPGTEAPAPSLCGAMQAIEIEGLAKSVGAGRRLFADLAMAVAPGELVAIVGESGVGKSTLLNILAGLDEADAGEVRIAGTPLGPLDEAARTRLRRTRIGFVFQAFHILPYLTLEQNVALPLALIAPDAATAERRAREMLGDVGLGTRGRDYARDLSGGELQRVAIARALVHRPAVILADEPTGNLDPETAGRILDLFGRAVRTGGAAGVMVTHSAATAAVADRVLTLTAHGLVAADG